MVLDQVAQEPGDRFGNQNIFFIFKSIQVSKGCVSKSHIRTRPHGFTQQHQTCPSAGNAFVARQFVQHFAPISPVSQQVVRRKSALTQRVHLTPTKKLAKPAINPRGGKKRFKLLFVGQQFGAKSALVKRVACIEPVK